MSEVETTTETATEQAPTVPQEVPAADPNPVDIALIEKLGELQIMVKIDRILTNGIYPGGMAGDLLIAAEWIKKKHGAVFKEAQAHKDFERAIKPQTAVDTAAIVKAQEKRSKKASKRKGH